MDIQTSPDPVARELGAEIAAAADEIERRRRLPEALLARLHDSRLFRMTRRSLRSTWQRSKSSPGTTPRSRGPQAAIRAELLVTNYLEPAVNRVLFADPRSIVAWGPPNASRARAVDGGYRLTRYNFVSGCRQARWMGAHCHVFEADCALRLNRFGRPTVRTLLFPAGDATLLDTWRTIGLYGTRRPPIASTTCSCPRRSAPHART